MKCVVLDTNVVISAVFWKGYPRTLYEIIKEFKIVLISNLKIEEELIRILSCDKFGLSPSQIMPIVNDLRRHINFIESN